VALNDLREVGIRVRLRPFGTGRLLQRLFGKELKNIVQGASGAFGNAATRAEAFV